MVHFERGKMRILILEDNQERVRQFMQKFVSAVVLCVEDADECIALLKTEKWDVLFLDHDLGGEEYVDSFSDEKTGYTVAKWLSKHTDRTPKHVFIHSLNSIGALNIQNRIAGSLITPFAWLPEVKPTFQEKKNEKD